MLHGPCGSARPSAPCMKDEPFCSKFYPKAFNEATFIDDKDGMPIYRRRNDGRTFEKGNYTFTNRDVVPYNPYLLLKYNAHINLEVCSSSKVVKYLYKYVYKGHDRANLTILHGNDEIKQQLDCRYLGAQEACWRLFNFDMQGKFHSVERLKVHLPGENDVTFKPDGEAIAVENNANKKSMLEAWFFLNQHAVRPEHARALTYSEVGEKYVYNDSARKWTPRKV
jgi:hypothetical protein